MISMDDKNRSKGKIGGPGHMVEIDHVVISSKIYMVRGFAAHLTLNHSHHLVDSVAMQIEFINQTNIK
jgi:hypothetical protein